MSSPMIVVNFKTYASASGQAAEALLNAMQEHTGGAATMVAAVSAFDLGVLGSIGEGVEVWSQHLDPVGLGGFTGWLEPQTAMGRRSQAPSSTMLNTRSRLTTWKHYWPCSPKAFQCVPVRQMLRRPRALAALGPTYIAVEPPS